MKNQQRLHILVTCLFTFVLLASVRAEEKTLYDFEGSQNVKNIKVKGECAIDFSSDQAKSGKQSLRLKIDKYVEGKSMWPGIDLVPSKDGVLTDWTGYQFLKLDIYNAGDTKELVRVLINSRDKDEYYNAYAAAPGSWTVIEVPLAKAEKVDLSKINIIYIYVTRPSSDVTLLVDNVRLTK